MDRPTTTNVTAATSTTTPSSTPLRDHNAFPSDPYPRLSISTPARVLLGSVSSGVIGFTLGAMQGGQMSQLRFRAEHAHKMPDTTTGWYFYHKSKNYHAMQGGIREGFRMGAKTSFWVFVALGLESTVDRYRGSSDMFSTTVATLSVAGAFSLWRKCDFISIESSSSPSSSSVSSSPLPLILSSFVIHPPGFFCPTQKVHISLVCQNPVVNDIFMDCWPISVTQSISFVLLPHCISSAAFPPFCLACSRPGRTQASIAQEHVVKLWCEMNGRTTKHGKCRGFYYVAQQRESERVRESSKSINVL